MIIRRKGALGDMILMTPAIRQLRLDNPNIYIGVETFYPDVFSNSPYVNEAARRIIKPNEKVVELDAHYEKNLDQHPIDAYARAILGHNKLNSKMTDLFVTEKDRHYVDTWWKKSIIPGKRVIVVHFGTTWVPIEGKEFDKLLHYLTKRFVVILVGRKIPPKEYYPSNLDGVVSLVDQEWSIHQLQWLIEKSDLFFGTDTGVMHIASTTNTPIVSCYSFVNPEYRKPFRDYVDFKAVVGKKSSCSDLFCAEKLKKLLPSGDFAGPRCPIDYACAKSISSGMMVTQIRATKMPFLERI